ncbi:hypothetical protein [Ottowia sp.]|uniref:hypothetical protein n=1 Tax=Ottowia sp. TaxID=1898956 RepID=UPI003A84F68A
MGNITVTRRSNLAWLLQRFLAKRIAQGEPAKGLEQAFAAALQISPSMLSQIKSSRPIGDKLARQIEALSAQPVGWLDEAHPEAISVPDETEERVVALVRAAWQRANAKQRREIRQWLASIASA